MKKLMIIIVLLMSEICLAQSGFIDTVYFKDGKKVICKIKEETSYELIYKKRKEDGIYVCTVDKNKLDKYIDVDPKDNSKIVVRFNNIKNSSSLLTLKDTVNYLLYEVEHVNSRRIQLISDIGIAGKNLKTTGIISITGLGLGIISGACFLIGNYYAQPTTHPSRSYAHDVQSWNTIGIVTGAISGACMLSIPIGIFSAGQKLEKLK